MPLLEKTTGAPAGAPGTQGHTDSAEAFVPDQSRAERRTSFDVADIPVPGGREEEWRFTPVDRLRPLFADRAGDDHDGDPAASYDVEGPTEAFPGTLAAGQAPRGSVLVPADRAAVVASANVEQALHVRVPAEAEYDVPLRVQVHGHGAGRRSNGHVVIEAGRHSRAVVVLEHTGSSDHTGNVEVLVGDGAQLTVVTIQHWDDDAHHLGQHDALVGRDATYKHIAVTLGGGIVRLNANVRYAGPGGDATLLGVYFADSGQHLEHRSFVDHDQPRCKSLVTYKGALQGESAHTVWVGDVLIRAEATDTETYELNRNLVLTDGARADSVPNLEIETGEIVGAGHASATGRFDDEQLFYLQARGIPEDQARRLVVRGFLVDVVNQIPVAELRDRLYADIDAELAGAAAAGAQVGAQVGAGA
ncbi:Fe-S cluster assembly protein SufD [Lapillicoccus jejuensis]|uniref:Iron-regulated ABC transporter permease protein SufD n=1 Tax=Lapillicoccus jejuensis TaxID=402171 RepID=A0A542E461_9MICO|nr:Fe-S cluster assembly protein SufD [Lapillicoccus jejuensis]TQJ10130.1 iron-regulated ABC transporter permease protein SufD [Lapillicoccus jejuensis]